MTAAAPRLPDMAAPGVQTLLGAVRRHLWLRQVAAAVRVSAWVSAAATLLAAAVHGAVRPVPLDAVAVAVGLLWCLMLARTAWRLPADGACALWADQHLGGESAFTTWLDTRRDAPGRGPAANPAVRWLESWAAARAPISLRALAARRDPTHLARPLLTLAVCGALASFVLGLPGLSPTPLQPAAAAAAATAPESALGLGDAAEPAARAGEIAAALRAAPAADPAAPGGGRRAPTAGPAPADDSLPSAPAQAGPVPEGVRPDYKPPSGSAAEAARPPTAGAAEAAGGGGGREAGDSADTRTGTSVSPVLRGTMDVQGVALAATRPLGQRQADSHRAASYESQEGEVGRRATAAARTPAAPAAATPPPATESMRLTPTQTSYVQAWMKASQRRP